VYNKGPTLIIIETIEGAICGGYTSKNWSEYSGQMSENEAFVFNMTKKYTPNIQINAALI
jgi:hypothetical protein